MTVKPFYNCLAENGAEIMKAGLEAKYAQNERGYKWLIISGIAEWSFAAVARAVARRMEWHRRDVWSGLAIAP